MQESRPPPGRDFLRAHGLARRAVMRITESPNVPRRRAHVRTPHAAPPTNRWVENPNPDPSQPSKERSMSRLSRNSLLAIAATAAVALTALTPTNASAFG